VFAKIYSFLSSLLIDSLYRAAEIEACVKEVFRLDNTLFSFKESNAGMLGLKVIVTIITILNERLYILSNYNRTRSR